MLLAVNMPLQEPQVGQACCSNSVNLASSILPADNWPTPSNTLIKSIVFPLEGSTPAFMGPPDTNTVGIFTRAAAISIPGTILSQLGMQIIASKQCARNMASTQSAINSRLAREYFIPTCPMAIPSQIPIVLNSNGIPPASRTAWRTFSPTRSKCACPGMICVKLFAIAINGLPKSLSSLITPVARNKLRWGARIASFLMVSLRIEYHLLGARKPGLESNFR